MGVSEKQLSALLLLRSHLCPCPLPNPLLLVILVLPHLLLPPPLPPTTPSLALPIPPFPSDQSSFPAYSPQLVVCWSAPPALSYCTVHQSRISIDWSSLSYPQVLTPPGPCREEAEDVGCVIVSRCVDFLDAYGKSLTSPCHVHAHFFFLIQSRILAWCWCLPPGRPFHCLVVRIRFRMIHRCWLPALCEILHRLCSFYSFVHPLIHSLVHPSTYSFIHPSTRPSTYSFVHPSIHPSIHLFINPSIHPFIHLFIRPSIHSLIHSSIHPPIHPSIHLFIHSLIHSQLAYVTIRLRVATGKNYSGLLQAEHRLHVNQELLAKLQRGSKAHTALCTQQNDVNYIKLGVRERWPL